MFTRPQTQAGRRAAARIPSASQIPAADSSGQASAGSNDRAGAGPGHDLLAGHPEMITSWLLLYRHGFLPARPGARSLPASRSPCRSGRTIPQTSDPCLQAR